MPIIKAAPTDTPELNVLVNSAYRGETSKLGWTTEANLLDGTRIDEETLSGYFNDPNITILKHAEENGQITGCLYLEVKHPKLYVGMFSVSPLLQNKGIGRLLLQAAENYAKQINCDTLAITVINTRHELISWYERRGFKATGELLPFHEGTKFGVPKQSLELIVMEKTI
jgi:GNAT superfamily N-acetyltransferase